jgi:nitroreductase
MDVYDTVRTVLAVRSFQDKRVPAKTVSRIVEAGRLTASSMNRQPWHYIVVDDRNTLHQLGTITKTDPVYCPGSPGDNRSNRKDDVRNIRREPGYSIDDINSLV